VDIDTKANALAAIKKAGLVEPRKPSKEISFPADLTDLTSQELGQVLTAYTGYLVYAEYLVAMADIEHTSYANKLEYVKSGELLKDEVQEYRNVSERNACVEQNSDVRKARTLADGAKAKGSLAKALLSGYDRIAYAVSREISRRQQEFDMTKR
tara:strand:- start:161 stop:622 length:462 start_codon:yes stop_codon:yes gene_type:complete